MVELQNISKAFNEQIVLDHINLDLNPHRIYGLRGRNGAGKTTLMNIILGIHAPDEGTVRVLGKDPQHDWQIRQSIGTLQEEDAYFPELTTTEFLWWVGRLRGMTDTQSTQQIKILTEQFYLTHKLDHLIESLSYGMIRKVLLAAAFMAGPQILLLDEPSNGLDTDSVDSLRTLLAQHQQKGGTALIISHNQSFIQSICTDIIVLADGKIIPTKEAF
ncbi:ABC transporter ATP-binding protein [Planctomycetota bacterium]